MFINYIFSGGLIILLNFMISFNFTSILNNIGFDGVIYYDQNHLNKWNRIIHLLFMPVTTFGLIIMIPALITSDKIIGSMIQVNLFSFYYIHYSLINRKMGLLYFILFFPSLLLGIILYFNLSQLESIIKGFSIAFISLFIQKIIGHKLDISREGVLNAIIYAMYSVTITLNSLC